MIESSVLALLIGREQSGWRQCYALDPVVSVLLLLCHEGGRAMSGSAPWSQRASWACDPRHVAAARTFVEGHLIQNGLTSEVEAVALVISELATNAVIHAGTPFTVTVARSNGTLSVGVRDLSFGRPQSLPSGGVLDERGRGLAMIAALSSTWGITALIDGKLVWATFDLTDAPDRRTIRGTSP